MKAAVLLLVASASALPQREGIRNIFSSPTENEDPAGETSEKVPYTVLKKYADYELRQYPSVKWACTELTYERDDVEDVEAPVAGDTEELGVLRNLQQCTSQCIMQWASDKKSRRNKPQSKMFMKLFRYISGVNQQQEEVEMTSPVLSAIQLLDNNMMTKEMCFYLEEKHQANPPTPVDDAVRIEQAPEVTVYVHTFGGYAMKDAVNIEEAAKFAEVLRSAEEEVDTSTFFTASYDSPMKYWNRRNEIMYLAAGSR